jgi:hypothetical protein
MHGTMTQDDHSESETGTALIALRPALAASLARVTPEASFLSQLIAERHRLAPQRVRRRAAPAVASSVYASAIHIADRRLPAGYRKNLVA